MITVTAVPAFTDNYLWLLARNGMAAVVDPGDAEAIRTALKAANLQLAAILITHHHADHTGGLRSLAAEFRVPVYGPRAEYAKIAGLTELLDDGDRVRIDALDASFEVLAVPGHTLGHIAYFEAGQKLLFCGDTLFVGGCGRLFEGTPAQMHASLARLAALPPETTVYCAHEYTLANLDFARAVEPTRDPITQEITRVQALRAAKIPSVPTTIDRERTLNPFLRTNDPALITAMRQHTGQALPDPVDVFAALRRWKDDYQPRIR